MPLTPEGGLGLQPLPPMCSMCVSLSPSSPHFNTYTDPVPKLYFSPANAVWTLAKRPSSLTRSSNQASANTGSCRKISGMVIVGDKPSTIQNKWLMKVGSRKFSLSNDASRIPCFTSHFVHQSLSTLPTTVGMDTHFCAHSVLDLLSPHFFAKLQVSVMRSGWAHNVFSKSMNEHRSPSLRASSAQSPLRLNAGTRLTRGQMGDPPSLFSETLMPRDPLLGGVRHHAGDL
mmetsp:Transcript_96569/g.270314  ORF Transcript_96569/g.270314 Transcript_96569/m.270314 type:complete len:230 (+) Transcript_96569:411-1100(+)